MIKNTFISWFFLDKGRAALTILSLFITIASLVLTKPSYILFDYLPSIFLGCIFVVHMIAHVVSYREYRETVNSRK